MADPHGPYRTFLRERIAPAVRQFGLKGIGNSFILPDDRSWALVGFQADWRYARADWVHFTVNLTVADKAAWERARQLRSYLPARPAANTRYGEPAETIRIGALVPISRSMRDRWWTIDSENPPDRAAEEVLGALRDHGLPWLRSRIARA